MTELSQRQPRRIAGVPINYLKLRRHSLPRQSAALDEYIDDWIMQRRASIHDVREHGHRAEQGQLDALSLEMIERWNVSQIGRSPVAWMERSMTSAAMLLDFRSRRFGRRVNAKDNWENNTLDSSLSSLEDNCENFTRPTYSEYQQALASLVFAREYQRYLNTLLIRPPGSVPPENAAFPSFWSEPDSYVKRILAEIAHCRPVGAFLTPFMEDEWTRLGGRHECRKRTLCPHCHARYFSRLVERVQQGPWSSNRRQGRRLVLVRVSVSTEQLGLSKSQQAIEREVTGLDGWLRPSTSHYEATPGEETTIRNIDCGQDLHTALTPHEVRAASEVQKQLRDFCIGNGLSGGICFHAIGPRQRAYLHELSVVGEVSDADAARFARALGIETRTPELAGVPIECVAFSPGHAGAPRLAIAGSSWKYDLDQIGASQNEFSRSRTEWRHGPAGLRGACAWQPLFLMNSVAYWSRWKVLQDMKFKSHQPFGEWRSLLKSDREHDSVVQKKRKAQSKPLANTPIRRIQRRIAAAGISQSDLATRAGVSRSAVSRFVKHGHGGLQLRDRLADALNTFGSLHSSRFTSADAVKQWLDDMNQTQRWLADNLQVSPAKVSRLLSGKTKWTPVFGTQVEELAERLASEGCCSAFTTCQSTQSAVREQFT